MHFLFLILLFAVVSDLALGRIPNYVTIGGLILSQIWIYRMSSLYDALGALLGAILIFLTLYPLFAIGCIGSGDIKLLMIFPGFIGISNAFVVIWISFLAGAVMGGLKLIVSGQMVSRIKYLIRYLIEIFRTGHIVRYASFDSCNGGKMNANQIHFSISIMLAAIGYLIKNYITAKGGL